MTKQQLISQKFAVARANTAAETQKILVSVAKREHANVMKADPQPASFERFVDGSKGALEESVSEFGNITYVYARINEIVNYIMDTLFDLSPVLSGEYRQSHTIFLNGVAVTNLEAWKPNDVVTITNPMPYARKIEFGHMSMRVSGTTKIYERVRRRAKRRFGNIAKITFTHQQLSGVAVSHARGKPDYRFPAIRIFEG